MKYKTEKTANKLHIQTSLLANRCREGSSLPYEIQESDFLQFVPAQDKQTCLSICWFGHHQHNLMGMNLVSYSYLDRRDPSQLGRPRCPKSRGSSHISFSLVLIQAFHFSVGLAGKITFTVCWGCTQASVPPCAALMLVPQANSTPWNPS